jgi:hypothetical protein
VASLVTEAELQPEEHLAAAGGAGLGDAAEAAHASAQKNQPLQSHVV